MSNNVENHRDEIRLTGIESAISASVVPAAVVPISDISDSAPGFFVSAFHASAASPSKQAIRPALEFYRGPALRPNDFGSEFPPISRLPPMNLLPPTMTELCRGRAVREREIAEHKAHVAAAYEEIVRRQQAILTLRDTSTTEMDWTYN